MKDYFVQTCLFECQLFFSFSYLLKRGADPLRIDTEGNIALHWGALSGSRSTCETLLNHGCDVNSTNGLGETPM